MRDAVTMAGFSMEKKSRLRQLNGKCLVGLSVLVLGFTIVRGESRSENIFSCWKYTACTIEQKEAASNPLGSSSRNVADTARAADFAARCSSPSVIRCIGFDSQSEINGNYGDNSGTMAGAASPSVDSAVKASGNASLRFTIPSNSGPNASGSYFTNFSPDLSVQFGENSEFYVQWRQRFSPDFLNTQFEEGEGWKQAIIGTGDQPGHPYASCTALELVVQNNYQRGFAQMYDSCTGSTSHGAYAGFQQRYGSTDFKLQNARPAPYCLYSQGQSKPVKFFPPSGNCIGYFPNEWMTFQVGVRTGPRVNDEFANSHVQLWIAREGQRSELVIDWGPYNLSGGAATENQRFGKIWLLPYHTGKSEKQGHPTGYIWYDELIVSRERIPDPK
jgi:hypothetical protein